MSLINNTDEFYSQLLTVLKTDSSNVEKINKSTLSAIIPEEDLTLSYVEKNNEMLSSNYGHISSMYGFDDFYSLYLYADSCELEELAKGGNKDLSKLKKVKRTVTRNGKPTEMTFYEETGSDEDSNNDLDNKKQGKSSNMVFAKDLTSNTNNGKGNKNSVKVKKLEESYNKLEGTGSKFKIDCDNYIDFSDEEGNILALGGVSVIDDYLYLSFFKSDTAVAEAPIRAFYEVIKLAIYKELGVMFDIPENKELQDTYEFTGLTIKDDKYIMKYKDLLKKFGNG